MKVLILAANGQIAQLVEKQILTAPQFKDVELTLFLRHTERLAALQNQPRVTLIEGNLDDAAAVDRAIAGQELVFVAVVDHTADNRWTHHVIDGMTRHHVRRVIFTNILGLYHEVPGEFGRWNQQQVARGLPAAIQSDQLLAQSGLIYTTLRLPWLNDRDEVRYQVTHRNEPYVGVSGSRQSVADLVLRIIATPEFGANDSLGLADPSTQGESRPVY